MKMTGHDEHSKKFYAKKSNDGGKKTGSESIFHWKPPLKITRGRAKSRKFLSLKILFFR
jgi:hypothetical protein